MENGTMDLQKIYLKHAKNELTEHFIYHKLAERERNPENKAVLEKLSLQERSHHDFWTELSGTPVRPRRHAIFGTILLRDLLGVTRSTLIAGISGVIVGFAAAISMASAAYLQAKQDLEKSPFISAVATGVSYLFSVICLALPYFLIRTMLTAFVASTSVGILLIAGFTYYGAVVFDRKFWSEFSEAAALMLGTAGATFALGTIIGRIFHLNAASF